jgi:hypothetical protein
VPDILLKIIQDSTDKLSDIIAKGVFMNSTITSKVSVYTYLVQIDKTIKTSANELKTLIPKIYTAKYEYGVKYAQNSIKRFIELKAIPTTLSDKLHTATLEYYINNIDSKYGKALTTASNTAKRIITKYADGQLQTKIQSDLLRGMIGTEKAPIKALERFNTLVGRQRGMQAMARDMFKSFNDTLPQDIKDIVSGKYIRIGSRNYNLAKYSELVAQASITEMTVEAEKNTYLENDIDIVQVDIHNTTSEVCAPYEGTLWSISGESKKHRSIDDCLNGGPPFHPRCSHFLIPYIDNDNIEEIRAYRENSAVRKAKERLERYIDTNANGRQVDVYKGNE